jgi:hypothetical protein
MARHKKKAAEREVAMRNTIAALQMALVDMTRSRDAWVATSNKLHARLDEITDLAGKAI